MRLIFIIKGIKEDLENPLFRRTCDICKTSTIANFEIVKKWLTDQAAKINEALIIKKRKLPNKQKFV